MVALGPLHVLFPASFPRKRQAVEKVVVGAVGGFKTGPNTTKTGPRHLRNGFLGLRTRATKGHEGIFW